MRIVVMLSLAIIVTSQRGSSAADRITYAIGGPAHRPVDTFYDVPMDLREIRLPILQGEAVGGVATQREEASFAEVYSGKPFLSEPKPQESLLKRSEALFLHFSPTESHEYPQRIEAPPTGSPFDGMPLATR